MTLVTVPQANPNDELTDTLINQGSNAIATVVNGNLDDTNISGISGTKVAAGTLPFTALQTTQTDLITADGWVSPGETWTYVSASTFTVSGDRTSRYTLGTRLKWTQTSVKYGVVVSSSYSAPNTTVTIGVNTDYTLANAAISSNYYSYVSSPQGYPGTFNFTPAWTGLASATTTYAKYSVTARWVDVRVRMTLTGANVSSALVLTAPITRNAHYAATSEHRDPIGSVVFRDNATATIPGTAYMDSGGIALVAVNTASTYATATPTTSTVPFTWASGDSISLSGRYEG